MEYKKVTVSLPLELLNETVKLTGLGMTALIRQGLEEIVKREKRSALRALRGKVDFELDIGSTRT